jgi:hypothetical protein
MYETKIWLRQIRRNCSRSVNPIERWDIPSRLAIAVTFHWPEDDLVTFVIDYNPARPFRSGDHVTL